jgi:hypothetical protein
MLPFFGFPLLIKKQQQNVSNGYYNTVINDIPKSKLSPIAIPNTLDHGDSNLG